MLVKPFTRSSLRRAVRNARAGTKDRLVRVCNAKWLKTGTVDRKRRFTEQLSKVAINEESTEHATAHCHAVQRGQDDSSVIAEAVLKLKNLLISPGRGSSK